MSQLRSELRLAGHELFSIFPIQFAIVDLVQRLGRFALITLEIVLISALILATRCANYQDVFVAGNVYFTDADCYARMTRVRLCAQHPGLVIRHHDFENFPRGTTPHTTAPLDYLILGLSILLKPFTAHAIDLAGASISPLLALLGGWFLWWWSRRMRFRFRWALLILYSISPILVHGTELGRPDHQSLLMLLIIVAICAEWVLRSESLRNWSMVSGFAWGLAVWVSFYEPLLLLVLTVAIAVLQDRHFFLERHRRIGWILFGAIVALALIIERRIPSVAIFQSGEIFRNWSRTIGELLPVSLLDPAWFGWAGYMIVLVPVLIWLGYRKNISPPLFILALFVATYLLTLWQARWAYFFISIFAIALPGLLEPIKSRTAVWVALILSILPIVRDWDGRIWPNEAELARRVEQRHEAIELRGLAMTLMSSETRPFLAPWWLSPSIAYWSGQPGVAGSSHESLPGIADTAQSFLATDSPKALEILQDRRVSWVVAYDADRVALNSAAILGMSIPERPFCHILDRSPASAPPFLALAGQDGVHKLFRVENNR